ncbi:free fatty acid receptor 3-like [Triplophysa rosa]|uniref:Ovarian cancer G-protein coupled receptor 1-like n=1 Tax=Triplophysa rosa TaxID=992332 RepID=A0A9W7TH44_TRIRA|nr:free fatty acid receptor 3-like [Triplophysa rosa]KAI7797135.1 putative ovarian cancer G-protein coupled receptor 1-like [Triplophysa rosa]
MTQHNISISINGSESKVKVRLVFIRIISLIEVPIMLLTLYALCLLVRSRHATSIFVIHLILSDLVQTMCQMIYATGSVRTPLLGLAYYYSLIVSVYLMACIALERYLLVSHPIWYKTHHSLKSSCSISLVIWCVPLGFADIKPPHLRFLAFPFTIVCLIPYLITALCFVGTWRGLSHATSLTPHKRRMILGTLFLVLLTYTFLLLPFFLLLMFSYFTDKYEKFEDFLLCLVFLNPLADCLLYLFMRSDVADLMPSLHCCCTSDTQQISVRYTTRTTQPSS